MALKLQQMELQIVPGSKRGKAARTIPKDLEESENKSELREKIAWLSRMPI
jgi:hypothetical protein